MANKNSIASPQQFDKTWDVGVIQVDNGVATLFNPNITANTVAFFQRQINFAGVPGFYSYSVFPGSRIEILSTQLTESCALTYMLIERNE